MRRRLAYLLIGLADFLCPDLGVSFREEREARATE